MGHQDERHPRHAIGRKNTVTVRAALNMDETCSLLIAEPSTLYPRSFILYHLYCIMYPVPCTLYPVPCTLYPVPCTLYPKP